MTRKTLITMLSCGAALLATACSSPPQDRPAAPANANEPLLTTPLRPYAQPLIPVTIDGKTYHFMLDTGAPYTFIDSRTAAALTEAMPDTQVPQYFREYIHGLGTLGNDLDKRQVTFWRPKPIFVGTRPVANSVPWVGIDLSALDMAYGQHIDGLLGATAFRQLNWGFDNVDHRVTIWALPPPTAEYAQCGPIEDSFGSGPALMITLANGNGGPMQIDTGASFESASAQTLRVFEQQGAMVEKIGQATRLSASGLYEANRYLVDGLHLGSAPTGRMRFYESREANNLGMSFLSRFDKYAFIPSEMLFCFTASHFTQDDKAPVRAVELSVEQGHLLIGAANRSDEGLVNGLEPGDLLLSINGHPAVPAHVEAIRRQLVETPSGELTLEIERYGEHLTVKL